MSRERFLGVLLFSGFLFLGSGCATKPVVPIPAANWKTVDGQVRYADAKRTFVADVTIREGKNAREYSMEVTKAGALLLKLDRSESFGWARGPLAHWPWSGAVENAPAHLQGWYRETTAALEKAAPDQTSGILFRLER